VKHISLQVLPSRVGVVYAYDDLRARVDVDAGRELAVLNVTDADVEKLVVRGAPNTSTTLELRLTEEAERRLAPALAGLGETQPFVVFADERVLFVGVVYTPIGAAAIRTPVLHQGTVDGRRVLVIASQLGAVFMGGSGDASLAARIDLPTLRSFFAERGRLLVDPPTRPTFAH
jgi:hypothetical protein